MGKHQGRIVEKAIRKSGYSILKMAEKLEISRKTLYNRFNQKELEPKFIMKVGYNIHYNFAKEFPHLQSTTKAKGLTQATKKPLVWIRLDQKNTALTSSFKVLYLFLISIAKKGNFRGYKRELEYFIETNNNLQHLINHE